jgi:hypothetical protein
MMVGRQRHPIGAEALGKCLHKQYKGHRRHPIRLEGHEELDAISGGLAAECTTDSGTHV